MNSYAHFCRFFQVAFIVTCFFFPTRKASLLAQPAIVDSLLQKLTTKTSDSAELEIHLELTMQFEYLAPGEIIDHANSAVVLAQKLNKPTIALRAQYQLAVAQYLSGDFERAEVTLRKVEGEATFDSYDKSLLDIYNLMGTILTTRDNIDEGLAYQFKALELSKIIPDTSRMITAMSNIATTYKSNLDTPRCQRYYLQALSLANTIKDTISRAVINNNLSEIMVDPDSMLSYARASLNAFLALDYKDGIAHSSNQFGVGLMLKKEYVESIPYFMTALEIWTPHSYGPGISTAAANLATNYGYLHSVDSSQKYAALAEKTGMELEDKTGLRESYEKLAEMYEIVGKSDLALRYLKKAGDLQDILYNNERAEHFAKAETNFKTREKERELIQKELTISQQENTKKSYLIILAIVLFLAIAAIQYLLMRQKFRKKEDDLELEKEKHASEKLRELDRLKSRFFADISHEFRTPLSLIQAPLQQAIRTNKDNDSIKMEHRVARQMHKSSEDLLSLVNQLLDLAKLEDGRLQLEIMNADISQFIGATGHSFESLAISKNIILKIDAEKYSGETWFDRNKLFHIITNLLSNALKFTTSGGQVTLRSSFPSKNTVEISVSDTGRGIPATQLPYIFDRFSSTSSDTEFSSTGIGLALTNELVKLYRGSIEVESTRGVGTSFLVKLPVSRSELPEAMISNEQGSLREDNPMTSDWTETTHTKDPGKGASRVLLVEDNAELLQFMKEILSSVFTVETACNGRHGLEVARSSIPNLIITDVMMPELDGFRFTNKVRESPETSHIPIIMLTAKADHLDRIQGLQTGVDDYLTKPFDISELLVRSQNLINQRKHLLKRFSSKSLFQPSEIASTPVDDVFLTKVMQTIESEFANPDFGVEDLSRSVAFSRSQLHRKLKALTDKSPNELIRIFRLERAKMLLQDKAGNASEIAYQVGFNSLPYFSKCYKDQFGISPSEV